MLMVAPERDTPGTSASACAAPMSSASRSETASPLGAAPGPAVGQEQDARP